MAERQERIEAVHVEAQTQIIEEERYELAEAPLYHFEMSRRSFVKLMGAGMAVVLIARDLTAQESGGGGTATGVDEGQIGAWLHIGEKGVVTICTGKVEVGQNIRTSLAQAVADELRVPLEHTVMIMGDTDLVPYDRGTYGSRSTPTMAPQLRRAAAAAREWILDLGATSLGVDRGELEAIDGAVVHATSGRSVAYGELTQGRQLLRAIDEHTAMAPSTDWLVAGRSTAKVNGLDFVTGVHRYPSDIVRRGMLVGKVLRPPSFGAELVTLDDGAARALPGVTVVRDGNFVGVTAPSEHEAQKAHDVLDAEWREQSVSTSDNNLSEHLRATAQPGRTYADEGSVDAAFASAGRVLAQTIPSPTSPMPPLSRERRSPSGTMARSQSGREHNVPSACARSLPRPSNSRRNGST